MQKTIERLRRENMRTLVEYENKVLLRDAIILIQFLLMLWFIN